MHTEVYKQHVINSYRVYIRAMTSESDVPLKGCDALLSTPLCLNMHAIVLWSDTVRTDDDRHRSVSLGPS